MSKIKCGYLGPAGTFSELAAIEYCKENEDMIPLKSIYEIFEYIKSGDINKGLVPVENSLEGAVNISMDLLYSNSFAGVIGEVVLPINNYLMVTPGVKLDDIKKIYSHPQPIGQSNKYLSENLKGVTISYTVSTAEAAEIVKGTSDSAVIGSERISKLYGLEIVAENIQDNYNNFTRFFVITNSLDINNREPETDVDYKTSIICAPEVNKAGVLYEILGEFKYLRINLTRIESRPTKRQLGEYLFYIDFEGHREYSNVARALENIEKKCSYFKVLGSYLKADI